MTVLSALKRRTSSGFVVNPVYLFCLSVLLVNDFYLKTAWGNAFTGKLSDVTGLVVFSGFLAFFFGFGRTLILIIAAAFLIWKSELSEPFIQWFNQLSPLTIDRVVDFSDGFALFVLPLYRHYSLRYSTWNQKQRWLPVVLPLAVFSIAATSVVDPMHQTLREQHTLSYSYSDESVYYSVGLSEEDLLARFDTLGYDVSASHQGNLLYYKKIHTLIPAERCTSHYVFEKEGVMNRYLDTADIIIRAFGSETEVQLYRLTVCYDQAPPSQDDALSSFERKVWGDLQSMAEDHEPANGSD
ncbi:hypothetical protein [Saccharospirillum sp. MSK14-1]|uniref:hypothetical protein n=1 Tax=Saccharospirillum sp. MSK14-1 TaxID=1897632 RepID=UPI001304E7D8|nr:hypothetical protein [Saccharospirillum sp. MSK14-1]